MMTLKYLSIAALLVMPAVATGQGTGGVAGGAQANTPAATATDSASEAAAAVEATADQAVADARAEVAAEAQAEPATPAAAGRVTAATTADIRAGVSVRDPQGGLVGTVESVDADGAVVSTGSVRAKLPIASFGKNGQGLVISLTKTEFEAAARAQSPS